MNSSKQTKLIHTKGFSLVELLVSVALFTIVITMAVGTLLVIVDANAKAQNMQDVMTNLTFALDSMSREIRTGRGYYCGYVAGKMPSGIGEFETQDCNAGNALTIVEGGSSLTGVGNNPRIFYHYNQAETSIERRIGDGNWVPITSNEVVIENMYFTVTDSSVFDGAQASVTIYIQGQAGTIKNVDTNFALQTTVTKRLLDI
jgi:prepilin-type N-terminal cleavage/methylation domain-containing protein